MDEHDPSSDSSKLRVPPSDPLQRALDEVFAPLTPEVMRATLAFEQIADADSTGMATITERVWHETAVTSIAAALMPKFDLQKDSAQAKAIRRLTANQGGKTLEAAFVRAQDARITVVRRIVNQMLKGLATIPSVRRLSVGQNRTATSVNAPSRELPLSVFSPLGNPVVAFQAREGALIALASLVPDRILPLRGFRQIADRRLQFGRGEDFLAKLHVSLRKARGRTRNVNSLKVDSLLLTMAQHWVNPDYPLWMMREPVATRVLEVAFGWEGDIIQPFRDRRQDYFPGRSPYVILDLSVEKLADDVRRVKAYKLAANEIVTL